MSGSFEEDLAASEPPDTRAGTPRSAGKLNLRSAIALSAIIWFGNLALMITASAASSSGIDWGPQLARLGIAVVGFMSTLVIHAILPRGHHDTFWKTLLQTIALCIPICAVVTVYSYYQFQWLSIGDYVGRKRLLDDFAFSFAFYLWIYISWAALYTVLTVGYQVLDQARRMAEIEGRAHEAQLLALRYQLNPHFFFNVLNTLSGLIGRHRLAEAEEVIINMADFLRYSLDGSPGDLVPLSEEISAQRRYLQIEELRFGDRLAIDIDIPRDCQQALVPALILQPLVENAIRHGVGRSDSPVTISIRARCTDGVLVCTVAHGAVPDGAVIGTGFGLGLRNVAERVQAIYGRNGHLRSGPTQSGGWESRLTIPLNWSAP